MMIGPVYLDWYTGPQYAFAVVGLLAMLVGALVLVIAALRAGIGRRFLAAATFGATALVVPLFSAFAPVGGPFIEQWFEYFAYGNYYGAPMWPALYTLTYGIPAAQSLSWLGTGLALLGGGMAANVLIAPRKRFDEGHGVAAAT